MKSCLNEICKANNKNHNRSFPFMMHTKIYRAASRNETDTAMKSTSFNFFL